MRTATVAITIVTIILVVLGINLFFQAEAVEHHGYKVDIKAGRSGCLSCHDDVLAKTIPRCMPVCLFAESHPVNQAYPPPNRRNEFKPVSVTEQGGIKFVDGKIDCISCHNLLVNNRSHLRIQNRENQLCTFCHKR